METNFYAMVQTANSKYAKVINAAYQLREDNSSEAFDKLLGLINSVYNDEIELIGKLCETESKREKEDERQKEVQVFGFMFR